MFTADMVVSSFSVDCGGNSSVRIGTVGGAYSYRIQHNKLVAVPLEEGAVPLEEGAVPLEEGAVPLEGGFMAERKGVSYSWYKELEDWRDILDQALLTI